MSSTTTPPAGETPSSAHDLPPKPSAITNASANLGGYVAERHEFFFVTLLKGIGLSLCAGLVTGAFAGTTVGTAVFPVAGTIWGFLVGSGIGAVTGALLGTVSVILGMLCDSTEGRRMVTSIWVVLASAAIGAGVLAYFDRNQEVLSPPLVLGVLVGIPWVAFLALCANRLVIEQLWEETFDRDWLLPSTSRVLAIHGILTLIAGLVGWTIVVISA